MLKPMFGDSGQLIAPKKRSLNWDASRGSSNKVELISKETGEVVSTQHILQVDSSGQSQIEKISRQLEKQGTALIGHPSRFGPRGAFVDVKIASKFANENGVIILNSRLSDTSQMRSVLGHEAYHAKMQAKRSRGETDLFNSEFVSKDRIGGTYDQYISSEEIHAWSKDFSQAAVKAHHRKTVQLIETKVKELPSGLTREEKLNLVKIKASTVVDEKYEKFRGEYEQVLDAHDRYLNDIFSKIEIGDFKLKFDDQSRVMIETDSYIFKPGNYRKLSNGSADMYAIQKELMKLKQVNEKLRKKMMNVDGLIIKANSKGYFTGSEYFNLKDEIAKMGSIVNQPMSSKEVLEYGPKAFQWKAIELNNKYNDQGYLIDLARVDEEVIETNWAYHGTSQEFFNSIRNSGIDNSKGLTVNGGAMKTGKGAAATRSLITADFFSKKTARKVGNEPVIFRWKTGFKSSTTQKYLAPPVSSGKMEYSIDGGNVWFNLEKTALDDARKIQDEINKSNINYFIPITSPIFAHGKLRSNGAAPSVVETANLIKKKYNPDELKKLNGAVLGISMDSKSINLIENDLDSYNAVLISEKNKLFFNQKNDEVYPIVFGINPTRAFSVGSSKSGIEYEVAISKGLMIDEVKSVFVPKDKIPAIKNKLQSLYGDKARHIIVNDIQF
jgi:hypothetical protein